MPPVQGGPAGRRIRVLSQDALSGGSVAWDGRDDAGRNVTDGLYVIRARTSVGEASTRVTIVR